ncbi:MAG: O-methyltransferase [Gammaproteobacteria bacterium]
MSVHAGDNTARATILEYLEYMRETQRGMMNIAPAEGTYLEDLIRDMDARRVLEIGTSNGYSAIWMGLGLRETGGNLLTLEIDDERYQLARKNIGEIGMEAIIDVRPGDAVEEIPRLEGPFDLVFIDAWKPDYVRYLELVLPLVRSGGIIAAHNVFHTRMDGIREYRRVIDNHPQLETRYVREGNAGISVSNKK